MKILMIGGTGIISEAVSELLIKKGHNLHLLVRGTHPLKSSLKDAFLLKGDINKEESVKELLTGYTFDAVIDWTVFTPKQAKRDIRLFEGQTSQYIFISSASAYQKPVANYLITEETSLENPFWQYSRDKIECENIFQKAYAEKDFPVTIVRPSLTYGDTMIPYVMNSWDKPWSLIDRIHQGKRVIVPGDGTSLWTITHNSDFAKGIAGLMGNSKAVGETFHVTSDEVLNWNIILDQIGEGMGVDVKTTHISGEFIQAFLPDTEGSLKGDKTDSVVFDNSKIKRFVPEFKATTMFKEGIAQSIAYLQSHPELQQVDSDLEKQYDRIIEAHDYGKGLALKH